MGGLGGRGCRDAREGDLRPDVKQHGRRRRRRWRGDCKLQDTLHRRKHKVHTASSTPLFTFTTSKFQLHASRLAPRASRLTPHTPPHTARLVSTSHASLLLKSHPDSSHGKTSSQRAPKCCSCSCSCSAPRNCSKLHLPALACAHLAVDQSTVPLVRHFVRLRKIHPPFSPQRLRRIVCSLVPYPGPGAAYPSSTPHLTHDPGQTTGDPPSPTGKRAPALSTAKARTINSSPHDLRPALLSCMDSASFPAPQ